MSLAGVILAQASVALTRLLRAKWVDASWVRLLQIRSAVGSREAD